MGPADPFHAHASQIARWTVDALSSLPTAVRIPRLHAALGALEPGMGEATIRRAETLEAAGYLRHAALERALTGALSGHMLREAARWIAPLGCTKAIVGAGECEVHGLGAAPPDGGRASEQDDIVQHNIPPDPNKPRERMEWEARQYRGLWYPAYMTNIASLTPDDVGVASAFLAGRLTMKGCPQSDKAKHDQDEKNKYRRGFMIFEQIAGVIAAIVMTVIFNAVGGVVTSLMHRAKMALIEHVWKEKIVRDPAIKLLLDKLTPTGPYTYLGYRFHLRPYGNMLLKELGCGGDLPTRLLLHGRTLRTLDVMVASSPKAKSVPGLYDYPSAFGMLRGSIFPPRGPRFDGGPAPKAVVEHVQKVMATPVMRAVIARPALSLTDTAKAMAMPHDFPTPPEAIKSAEAIRRLVKAQQAGVLSDASSEKPVAWPLILVGGAVLGTALLIGRDSNGRS